MPKIIPLKKLLKVLKVMVLVLFPKKAVMQNLKKKEIKTESQL